MCVCERDRDRDRASPSEGAGDPGPQCLPNMHMNESSTTWWLRCRLCFQSQADLVQAEALPPTSSVILCK